MSSLDELRDEMIRNALEIQRLVSEDYAMGDVLKERWTTYYDRWKESGPHTPSQEKLIQERLRSMTMVIEEATNCHRQLNQNFKSFIHEAMLLSPKPSRDLETLEDLLMTSRRFLMETLPRLHRIRDRQVFAVDQLQCAVDSIISFD